MSTSLMYSFAQRSDCQVRRCSTVRADAAVHAVLPFLRCCREPSSGYVLCVQQHIHIVLLSKQVLDEPLYAHFLRLTGAERPYTELVGGRCCLGCCMAETSEEAGHKANLVRKGGAVIAIGQLMHVDSRCPSPPVNATQQVMQSQEPDSSRVVAQQLLGPRDKPLLYAKHMAK